MKETLKDIASMLIAGIVILAMIAASTAGIYAIGVMAAVMSY